MGTEQPQSFTRTLTDKNYPNIDVFLKQYNFVCQVNHDQLGKFKIYRKIAYNFDYVCRVDKVVDDSYLQHLQCFLQLSSPNSQSTLSNSPNQKPANKPKQAPTCEQQSLWLQCHCYSLRALSPQTSTHLSLCQQYLTYTLQEYILQPPSSLLYSTSYQTSIAPNLLYIIKSMIKAFQQLLSLTSNNPNIPLVHVVNCITNPALVFIDLEGCVRFMGVPLVFMPDFVNNVDKCLMRCCQWDEDLGRKVVSGWDGTRVQGLGKVQRMFAARLKRLIKWINKQLNKKSGIQTYTDDSKTQQPFKQKHNLQPHKSQISSPSTHTLSQLQPLTTLDQIRQYLSVHKSRIPTHLLFSKCQSQEPQNRHPSSLSRQKIRLQKTARSIQSYHNNNNRTISNFSGNSYELSTLQDNKGQPRREEGSKREPVSHYQYFDREIYYGQGSRPVARVQQLGNPRFQYL